MFKKAMIAALALTSAQAVSLNADSEITEGDIENIYYRTPLTEN